MPKCVRFFFDFLDRNVYHSEYNMYVWRDLKLWTSKGYLKTCKVWRCPSCFSHDGGLTYYDQDEMMERHTDPRNGASYVTYTKEKVFHTAKKKE